MTATMVIPSGPDMPLAVYRQWQIMALPSVKHLEGVGVTDLSLSLSSHKDPNYWQRLSTFAFQAVFWIVRDQTDTEPTQYQSIQAFVAWACLFTVKAEGAAKTEAIRYPHGIKKVHIKFKKTQELVKLQFIDVKTENPQSTIDAIESIATTAKISIAIAAERGTNVAETLEERHAKWRAIQTQQSSFYIIMC